MVGFIIKGITIGMLVSAPLGPSGMLCIQRTLSKGRRSGFVTGLGIAMSDVAYALLTGLGMTFVVDFIETNQTAFQIVGSLVMLGFGVYLMMHNPITQVKKSDEPQQQDYFHQFWSGFLLTIPNVTIAFLFIALYAHLGFVLGDYSMPVHLFGYLLILIGAMLWWYLVTMFVHNIKKRYNIRNIWIVNKTTGLVIITVAILGLLNAIGIISALDIVSF